MKKLLAGEKGITIITVTTMVIVMLIIISTLVFYARNSVQMESLQGLKADISEIEAKALIYYTENKAVPLVGLDEYKQGFQFGDESLRNPNDSDMYYLVDIDKLGVTKAYNTNYYINEKTLTVYAETPILMNGKYYGRFKEDFVKFNDTDTLDIPDWARNVPADFYQYDDRGYITGINTSYVGSHSNNAYYTDAHNWKSLIIPAYGPDGNTVQGIATGAFSDIVINGGPIKIPFTVKIIEANIFGDNCNPTELYCDANVVDVNAFANLKNLPKVTIGPNCIMKDGTEQTGGLFSNCTNLKTIIIEGSSIGKYTFARCENVENIYFLGSPNAIPEGAFYACGYNSSIGMLRIHTNLSSTINECVFPSSIIKFEPYCFRNSGIINLRIPDETLEIGRGAFSNMPNRLESVVLNDKLRVIGDDAFNNNVKLTSVLCGGQARLGAYVTDVGVTAFRITGLTSISVKNSTNVSQDSFPVNCTVRRY